MRNIADPRLLWFKGGLFLLLGSLAAGLLLYQNPSFSSACLLCLAIWGFCRAYYFAFYVIQHYADPEYRFAGLIHFARYAILGSSTDTKQDLDATKSNAGK